MEQLSQKPDVEELLTLFSQIEPFSHLEPEALQALAQSSGWKFLPSGAQLCDYDAPGDRMFVVVSGRLRAFKPTPRGERVIGEIGMGECVGEMSLLTGETRSAKVCAIRDSGLAVITREDFDQWILRYPKTMLALASTIIRRLDRAQTHGSAPNHPVNFAVIPFGSISSRFSERLAKAMNHRDKAMFLSSDRIASLRGGDFDPHDQRAYDYALLKWLSMREQDQDYLVYQCEPGCRLWTDLCLRQADCILLVGMLGENLPNLPEYLERWVSAPDGPRIELVLCQEGDEPPTGTRTWLQRFPHAFHHHLRIGNDSDMGRLVRLLTHRATGLVLGGGGARCFAHIGVLRAFDELGIPIDLIGGTSMGAMIGAQFAMGWDTETMIRENRRAFVESGSVLDYTMPLFALLAGRRFKKMGLDMFGNRLIEDLPIRFFCMTTDLTHAEAIAHFDGPIENRLRASTAVPGLLPPIFLRNKTLVDGGVLNNLPVDVMLGLGRGPIFAVDVSPTEDVSLQASNSEFPSPWPVFWRRINPFAKNPDLPSILTILLRSVSLSSVTGIDRVKNQLTGYLRPPIDGISLLDWRVLDRAVELGYSYARTKLEEGLSKGSPGSG
ncbi:Patatin-like phospholipase family protein [Sulfidibacter corallicola]|uniref:Patatin-like phospholipase family protein n=1 Tax=Sulfidibacter corallicola TaxID=2818388 RepID=A0A8A4TKC1_SULCO|nr:cyclic nucleotide-binding and patatin-like phospholipase domain-containing protein [Sulfidibacter corallicola]QTD50459.1 patatin-like phospholipase family protein [Sulfidibacter corallicola]